MSSLGAGVRLKQFELVERIGAGGMGEVWKALDANLGRHVALKVMRPEPSTLATVTNDVLPRLRDEAQLMAKLQHPNIAVVHAIEAVDDRVFIAMELLEGGTLREWLKAAPRSWPEITRAFAAAGRGLDAAHREGIVHCDFKPDNVMLGSNGEVRVTDFGIARNLETDAELGGVLAGTPGYMAPEQITGRPIDARADQFAFCVSLWEALVGSQPFDVETVTGIPTVAMRLAAMTSPLAKNKLALPRDLIRLLEKGLAADREERFATMETLVDALEDVARTRDRRRRVIVIAGGGAMIGGAIAIVLAMRPGEIDSCSALADRAYDVVERAKGTPASATVVKWAPVWRDERIAACRDEPTNNDALARAACLDDELLKINAYVADPNSDLPAEQLHTCHLAIWLGRWTITGTQETRCQGAPTPTDRMAIVEVITAGPRRNTIETHAVLRGAAPCVLVWSVVGSRAELDPGQRCYVESRGEFLSTAMETGELIVDAGKVTLRLVGKTTNGCTFLQQAVLTK